MVYHLGQIEKKQTREYVVTPVMAQYARNRLVDVYAWVIGLAQMMHIRPLENIFAEMMLKDINSGYIIPRDGEARIKPIEVDSPADRVFLESVEWGRPTQGVDHYLGEKQGRRAPIMNQSRYELEKEYQKTVEFAKEVAGWSRK